MDLIKHLYYHSIILSCLLLVPTHVHSSKLPHNKHATWNVVDFGAQGDGKHLDTKAIQTAIDTCTIKGGTVFIPAGTYLSGTLFLKSNVTLHIAESALLLGSKDLDDYPKIRPQFSSYNDLFHTQSLIYAENLENIAITGKGVIDGQGNVFRVTTKKRPDRYKDRPFIIWFVTCKNVFVENITLKNSAAWIQHYLACEDVIIRGIKVYNHCNQNNDMIDIDGCKNVIISDCIGDTDDDALTIKSTSGRLSENITVTNCVLSSHCNAIKLGTESHGGFKNIVIENCIVKPSRVEETIFGYSKGIGGIVLTVVDGGILDGVQISNIRLDGPKTPIFMRLGNRGRVYREDMEKPPIGSFRNVILSNIIATQADSFGCSITGLPGHALENITLNNVHIEYKGGGKLRSALNVVPENAENYPESTMFGQLPSYGFFIRHVKGVTLNNLYLSFEQPDYRPAIICDDVAGLDIIGLRADGTKEGHALIKLNNSQDVLISQARLDSPIRLFLTIEGAGSRAISLIGNDLRYAENFYQISEYVDKNEVQMVGNLYSK